MAEQLYRHLASIADAMQRCEQDPARAEFAARHRDAFDYLVRQYMPSGCGVDSGTRAMHDRCTGERLTFQADFHHMTEHGFYDGWTEHVVTVRPSLVYGFTLSISGRDRNDIKDYLSELYDEALRQDVSPESFDKAYGC